jgi:hypothetical protein
MPSRPRRPATATSTASSANRPRAVAAGVTVTNAPALRVAAFGDSLMWGQGLRRAERFTALITTALRAEVGRGVTLVWDRSRSGAEIRATGDQRVTFVDTYPHLFPNGRGQDRFVAGTDDTPATGLYGELPSRFPTVRGQVRILPIAEGRRVDIALVDGGINDINVEDIVNPLVHQGKWIEWYEGLIRKTAYDVVLMLLSDVRKKCPNAVVLYFGAFLPISYVSNPNDMRALFRHEYDDDVR